ncbi:MAG: Trp biosynthesis-associated membrane protein [Microbacteriaceae bacterium]
MNGKSLSLLFAAVGGALILIAAPQIWVTVAFGGSEELSYELSGQDVAPALVALGSAVLAAVAVIALVPFAARLVFSVLGLLAAGGAAFGVWAALGSSAGQLGEWALIEAGVQVAGFDTAGLTASWSWLPWLTAAAALLAAFGFALALLTSRGWSQTGQRYERRPHDTETRSGQWDALSEGDDPTVAS